MRKPVTPILLSVLLTAAPLAAGTILNLDYRDLPDGTPEPTVMKVDGESVAVDDEDGRLIFRGDRQDVVMIDHEDKTYTVLDATMVQGVAKQMDAAMKQMEEAIEALPKEQQEIARRMMQQSGSIRGGSEQTTVENDVRRTSERETREGYPCVKFEVYEEDVKTQELWVTDWSNVAGHENIAGAIRSMMAFLDETTSAFAAFGGASKSSELMLWHEIDGMPVVTTDFENGTAVGEWVVRSIENARVDAATFAVPEGYTQQTIGGS